MNQASHSGRGDLRRVSGTDGRLPVVRHVEMDTGNKKRCCANRIRTSSSMECVIRLEYTFGKINSQSAN